MVVNRIVISYTFSSCPAAPTQGAGPHAAPALDRSAKARRRRHHPHGRRHGQHERGRPPLLKEDPEFQGLIEDCRVIHAMPRDAWRARAEAYARDAAERAMVDGRVSTLNLCLKATGILANAPDDAEDDPDAWMDQLTGEELAEHEALGDEAEEPAVAAEGDAAGAEPDPLPASSTPATSRTLVGGAISASTPSSALLATCAARFAPSPPPDEPPRPNAAPHLPTFPGVMDRAARHHEPDADAPSARPTPSLHPAKAPSHPPSATAGP
jgi:hypothetical protein